MGINIHHILTVSRTIIFVILGVYIGISVLVFLFQSRFIYHPTSEIYRTPAVIRLPYETVTFESGDGTILSGWFIPAEEPRGTVLYCHGNGGNISDRLESIEIFRRLHLDVFIFDYRGYGESEGKPNEKGTYLDAEASWNWLTVQRGVSPDSIIIFGRSLGGSIAAWLAGEHTPKALIIDSSFTSAGDMGKNMFPLFPVKLLLRFKYTTVDYLQKVKCPVLVIHSPDDELVPYSHGKHLFEAAHEPKEFLEIRGSHNDGFSLSGKRYEEGLNSFISRLPMK